MRKRYRVAVATLVAAALVTPGVASAHDVDLPDGHLPTNINYGFEVVGRDTLAGITDGLYTDVWSHDGYAYVGTFQEPDCTRAGVFVVDIDQAIDNHAAGDMSGAVVAEIKSAPNTRVNDVKVHTVTSGNKSRDILVATEEKCGELTPTGKQLGQGGISLYDVTDPTKPVALKQHALATQVHNTFSWTGDDGKSYLIAVDDENVDDVIVVDITKPQSPKTVSVTGIGSWLAGDYPQIADDNQLFTGNFAAPLLHDVWVTKVGDTWQALLSYWDAGFVMLDVTDPTNPTVLGDSTYPDPDPVFGTSPAEGNGHAGVFGGDENQYLWTGDEDFDPFRNQVIDAEGDGFLATQGSDVPQITPDTGATGPSVYVGEACTAIDPAPSADAIAIILRGTCAFTVKAGNAEAAGYQAAVVFNHAATDGCETSISMLVEAGIPAVFLPRSAGFEVLGIQGYDPGTCDQTGSDNGVALLDAYVPPDPARTVTLEATFDGWGYFHVLNNLPEGTTAVAPPSVPGETPEDRETLDVDYLGEMGYFAPIEVTNPDLATNSGDLTMHNVEGDPLTAGTDPTFDFGPRSFISWYSAGMRAVEYRPGHWHTGNGGVASWNVHEVGRFIAEDGSNFWGVHLDEHEGQQIILGSDRNTGLWIFTFECVDEVLVPDTETGELIDSGLYCRKVQPPEA